jgi:hypothetical protein
VGVVLPRGAFINSGSEKFRREVINEGEVNELTFIKNSSGWAFEGMEPRFTIGLFAFKKGKSGETNIPIRGPYADEERFEEGVNQSPHYFSVESALGWMGSARFPLLPPEPMAVEAFGVLDQKPRLDYYDGESWRARPHRELDSSMDKVADDGTRIMHFIDDPPDDYWPVLKGGSFRIWQPDTGVRYAWSDPDIVKDYLQEKRENSYQYAGSRSAFYEMDEDWVNAQETLPCFEPRVVF